MRSGDGESGTHRAYQPSNSERSPSKSAAAGGVPGAYAEAFSNRELRLTEFAAWMRVQRALSRERKAGSHVLAAFEESIRRFLPDYRNLRASDEKNHIETRISYGLDGTISSNNTVFDRQLNDVLDLNLPRIKSNRRSSLTAMLDWWKDQKNKLHRPPPKAVLEEEIKSHAGGAAELNPYSQVAVWFLRQKLAGMP